MSFIQPLPCDSGGDSGSCCPNIFTGYCLNDGTPIAITIINGVQTTWTDLLTGVVTPGPPPAGTGLCDSGDDSSCCPNIFTGYCLEDGTPIAITIVNGVQTTWTDLMTGVVTPGPPPAGSGICEPDDHADCCPNIFTGYCLDDGTPIAITIVNGVQTTWTNLMTGVVTAGPPPIGAGVCSSDIDVRPLTCETDSITICPGDEPIPVTVEGLTVSLSCETDSITICPGDDPIDVIGTVTVNQGTSPWVIGDGGGSITVDAVNLDIRDLVFATDKVDVSGSTVTLDAGTLAALETITVLQGTSPWVISAIDLDIRNLVCGQDAVDACVTFDYAEDIPHVSGDIGAFVLAVRNDLDIGLTSADLDYSPIAVTSTGKLKVDATGSSVKIVSSTHHSGISNPTDNGFAFLAVVNDDGSSLGAAEDDYSWVSVDSSGRIGITDLGGSISIDDNGGSITVDGTVTVNQGTSPWVVSGTVTADTNFDYPEDSPHVSGNPGAFVLAVRNDAGTPLAADGDYIPFTTDSSGSLRVTIAGGSSVTQTGRDDTDNQAAVATGLLTSVDRNYIWDSVGGNWDRWTGAVTQGTSPWVIGDGGGSITVDGTITVNQGTSPWVVSGTVTADTNFDYPEDSGHVSGNVGAFVLAVRNDSQTVLTSNDLDYSPIAVDSTGAVKIVSGGSALGVTTNYEYLEDDPHVDQNVGAFVLAVRNDARTNFTDADGDYSAVSVNGAGEIQLPSQRNEDVAAVSGSAGQVILGVRNDAGATLTSANGDYSWLATDAAGRIGIADLGGSISIDDNGGSITVDGTVTVTQGTSPWVVSGTVTADTNFDYPEDSVHVSGNPGAFVLAVRNDAGTPLAADGDYIPFTTDSTGALRVTGSTAGTVFQHQEILCDDNGPFVRKYIQDVAGLVTSVVDFDFEGDPYVTVGTVEACPSGGTSTVYQHQEVLCDDDVTFIRKYIQDVDGVVTSVVDFDLDGDPYVVTGIVQVCSSDVTPVTPQSLDSTVDRLVGVGSIAVSSGGKSVTVIVYAGNPTVTIDADPAVTLVPGMSLTWAVDDRTESLLNAFTFTGTSTSDMTVFTTSGPLESDVLDSSIQRLTGVGSVVIAAGASSTTITVISGTPTVQIGAGPVITLTTGMSLTWAVDSDNEDLLDAFTFSGASGTDFIVTSTRI